MLKTLILNSYPQQLLRVLTSFSYNTSTDLKTLKSYVISCDVWTNFYEYDSTHQ